MADELVVPRGNGGTAEESMKAALNAWLSGLAEEAATIQVAGPPRFWDVIAVGPYQSYALEPSRVMEVGEPATIMTIVVLNPSVPSPFPGQNACDIITGFGGKIEINYFTSNAQTMTPVSALTHSSCVTTTHGVCVYTDFWTFTPREPACLYETNICVRICNCNNLYVRQYSGFARWAANLDYDWIFGAPTWQFDHPIRYMVSDYNVPCACP